MVKEYSDEITIEVPIGLVYRYFDEKYSRVSRDKKKYGTLSKHEFEKISSVLHEKIIFQERYLFTRAVNTLEFKKESENRTKVKMNLALTWSPFRKKIAESSFLGLTSNLRSLELMYRLIEKEEFTSD